MAQPTNKSFLSPVGFVFNINRMPAVTYFCISSNIPELSLPPIDTFNPFIKIPVPGKKLEFGTLNIRFRIDEDMKNYIEIYDWLLFLGFPDSFDQRKTGESVYSDASLIVTTAASTPNLEVKFVDMFPISLSATEFDTDQADIEYLVGSASFSFRKYELTRIV